MQTPRRYSSSDGTSCLDMMVKVFGKTAVLYFAALNIFKYSWRMFSKDTPGENAEKIRDYADYIVRATERDEGC